jgi:23S rRNA-/tRNA-specific pseudouridylate synthase
MHQIRVHLASIGHPVVGDDLYGRSLKTGRMLLHAAELKILDYDFKSKVPEEFGSMHN